MEIVTKEQYWIDILNDNSKFGQITTEDTSFNLRANDVWKVIKNSLLVTEDEEDVANWEGITQLSDEGLTIFQRKVNILYVLSTKSYVPISLVEEIASKTSGKDVEIFYDKEQGKLVVHTDRAEGDTVEITNSIINKVLPESVEMERYNHNIEVSWQKLGTFEQVVTVSDLQAICPTKNDFNKYLTSDGEFCYPMPNANENIFGMYSATAYLASNSLLKKLELYIPKDTLNYRCFQNNPNLVEASVYNETNIDSGYQFYNCPKLKKLKFITKGSVLWEYFCSGNTSLEEVEIVVKINNGLNFNQAFSGCILNKASALGVLNQMYKPTYFIHGKNIATVGIHIDNQGDEDISLAIENAEKNGWTIEIQWNGTPSSQAAVTYNLRKRAIYAKKEQYEYGLYCDNSDIKYTIHWAHEIYNPDGKSPEELGYQEFASLEEALTTWGLTVIMEIPEQES